LPTLPPLADNGFRENWKSPIERNERMIAKYWDEFKAFAFKGNMIDLAVAVVIGGAFGKIITAIVNDIIMPIVNYALVWMPGGQSYATIHIGKFMVGDLLSEIINFIIVAAAVFFVIVKMLGAVMKKAVGSTPAPSEPTTKECPMCLSNIPLKAKKCAFCTTDLG
jgi:large conductance mechanosensitive channel